MVLRLNIVKITILPQAIYSISAIYIIPSDIFGRNRKIHLKILQNLKGPKIIRVLLKKEQSWKNKLISMPSSNATCSTTAISSFADAHQSQKCCLLLQCLLSRLIFGHHLHLNSAFLFPTTPRSMFKSSQA